MFKLKNIFKILNPAPPVGAIQITNRVLRYVLLDSNRKILHSEEILINEGGDGLRKALDDLVLNLKKAKVTSRHVVISLLSDKVYLQNFSLPRVAEGKTAEAVKLNLQLISPLPLDQAYTDAEFWGEATSDKMNFLAAFIERVAVDNVVAVLSEVGFVPVAVEVTPLSLARVLKAVLGDMTGGILAIQLIEDGFQFILFHNGNIAFNSFLKKELLPSGDLNKTKAYLENEFRKIYNFYAGEWGGVVSKIVLVNLGQNKELRGAFLGLGVSVLDFTLGDLGLSDDFASAFGAALRGLISRDADEFISLEGVGTELHYWRDRLLHFLSFWRNVFMTILASMFLVFWCFSYYVGLDLVNKEKTLDDFSKNLGWQEYGKLEEGVNDFNNLVDQIQTIKKNHLSLGDLILNKIASLAKDKVFLDNINLKVAERKLVLIGRATFQQNINDFKNDLVKQADFSGVNLVSIDIVPNQLGDYNFQISLNVK